MLKRNELEQCKKLIINKKMKKVIVKVGPLGIIELPCLPKHER